MYREKDGFSECSCGPSGCCYSIFLMANLIDLFECLLFLDNPVPRHHIKGKFCTIVVRLKPPYTDMHIQYTQICSSSGKMPSFQQHQTVYSTANFCFRYGCLMDRNDLNHYETVHLMFTFKPFIAFLAGRRLNLILQF